MKTRILSLIAVLGNLGIAHAGGPLTPPGAPAPTQKSLQEIWDKIATLETQITALQTRVTDVQAQNTALQAQNNAVRNQGLLLHYASGSSLPWTLSTVDSVGGVGLYNSLAFDSEGQPAISYRDNDNNHLKFARMGLVQP